jgi:ribulose-5-phosphate 4-epimerase/fuculose-1-phosphate aldolase
LRGHGAVTVGEDVMTCFNVSIWLEENAKKQLAASSLGNPRVLTEDECTRLRAQMWRPEVIRKTWDFFTERGHTTGILESDPKVQEEGL